MAWQDPSKRFFLPADPTGALADSPIREVNREEWELHYNDRSLKVARDTVGNKAVLTHWCGYYSEEGELALFLTEVFDGDFVATDPNSYWIFSNVDTREQALRNHKRAVIRLAADLGLLPEEDTA